MIKRIAVIDADRFICKDFKITYKGKELNNVESMNLIWIDDEGLDKDKKMLKEIGFKKENFGFIRVKE